MVGGHLRAPPPTYDTIIQEEKALPQHELSLPFPEGKDGQYVKFSNQIKGLGWNNVFNEILLCSYLAWRAKRAYVFQDYVWEPKHYPWRIPTWPQPRTPLSALIAGPTAGGGWEEGDMTPRSIGEDHWEKVCPPEDTEVIDTGVAKAPIQHADAKFVFEHWLRLINESPKRCVNIEDTNSQTGGFPQTFDLWVISTPHILTIWPEFRDSPVSRLLKTSPLVNAAIQQNEPLFFPSASNTSLDRYEAMMAMHLRQGDYITACQGFSDWKSTFYGWNQLPELPDSLSPRPENERTYLDRCFPSVEQLLRKIRQTKLDWETGGDGRSQRPKLHSLYIMTNADEDWLKAFKALVRQEGGNCFQCRPRPRR